MTSHSPNDPTTQVDPDAMNISVPAPAIHPTTLTTLSATHQEQPQSQLVPHLMRLRDTQTFVAQYRSQTVKDWVPCILSPAQVQGYLEDTRHRIQHIHALWARSQDSKLDEALFRARLEYKIHFSRIFRINDLPPEILTEIFRYIWGFWVPEGPDQSVEWHLSPLTWVCRHWRGVALSDPTLWNTIWFRDIPNFEMSFTYLERSVNAPLSIRISDTHARPFSLAEMQYLLSRLFKKVSNIRIVAIILQEWDLILFVLRAFCIVKEKNLPMILERFYIHYVGPPLAYGASHEHYFTIPLFGGATVPSFKCLSLIGVHIDWANSVLTNLTRINIRLIALDRAPTLTQFRELFDRSPALQNLCLDGTGPSGRDFISGMPVKPIHIPSLRVLVLGNFPLNHALYICSLLSTPNVSNLTMVNFTGGDYSTLYDALRSTMPLVTILTFYRIDFFPTNQWMNSIIRWLQSMPQVTYFRFGNVKPQILEVFLYDPNYNSQGSLIDEQTPEEQPKTPQEQTIPCPKLAFLDIADDDADQIEVIIRWVHTRKHLGSPLRRIYLKPSLANRMTVEQFQRLAAGLGSGGKLCLRNPRTTTGDENLLMNEDEGIQEYLQFIVL